MMQTIDSSKIFEYESNFASINLARAEIMNYINENINDVEILNIDKLNANFWCIQEMLSNAIEHGNKFDSSKKIIVKVEIEKSRIIITIRDQGDGFDWQKKLQDHNCLLSPNERGRGIVMSSMLSSNLSYNDIGNEVTIIYDIEAN